MGDNSANFESRREQYNDSRLFVLSGLKYNPNPNLKPFNNRMEKLIWNCINIFFPTGYGLVLLLNIDNIKGIILFIIAVLYGIARLFFYVVKQNQERRMRELEIEEKKRDVYSHDLGGI